MIQSQRCVNGWFNRPGRHHRCWQIYVKDPKILIPWCPLIRWFSDGFPMVFPIGKWKPQELCRIHLGIHALRVRCGKNCGRLPAGMVIGGGILPDLGPCFFLLVKSHNWPRWFGNSCYDNSFSVSKVHPVAEKILTWGQGKPAKAANIYG